VKPRPFALAVLTASLCAAVPASAGAATLTRDHSCYRASTATSVQKKAPDGEPVTLSGTGFTPSAPVYLLADGKLVAFGNSTPLGVYATRLVPPYVTGATRNFRFTAVDKTNPAVQAATTVKLARLRVTLGPASFRPGQRLRVRARGFTRARSLYAHVRRGRYHKNIRIGRLKKCGVLSRKRKIIRKGLHSGHYRVQFDTHRHYSSKTRPAARFRVKVFRVLRPAAASASAVRSGGGSVRQEWTRVK
jgi:hypothetical protein